jgi:hypothetical protein
MGQRHQVYLKTQEGKIVGLHHQWLYGKTAVNNLARLLTFIKNSINNDNIYWAIESPDKLLEYCYSFDIDRGYIENTYKLSHISPLHEDNNNGITCIDLTDINNPTYCFASLNGLECLGVGIKKGKDYSDKVPMGYKTWVYLHYPEMGEERDSFLDNYKVMSQETLDSFLNP